MNALIDVISKTFDANQDELNTALAYLNRIADEDYTSCIQYLVEIICSRQEQVNNQPIVPYKLQSCLQLKNILLRKPDTWHLLTENIKNAIKCSILDCFRLDHVRQIGLAHVVLTLAQLELPQHSWQQLIPSLAHFASLSGEGGSVSIQTLGYICETINPDYLEAYNNQILTVLVHTIRRDDTDIKSKLDSLTALQNSLNFAASNFARLSERNYLMQVICECTQHTDLEIKTLALQCLSKAITLYYPLMDSYMCTAVWPIVTSALTAGHGKETLVLQGLEIINSVCDAELKYAEESGEDDAEDPECIVSALPRLLSGITQAYLNAGPSLPLDWSVGQAVQVSLRMLTRAATSSMLNLLLPNILQNLNNTDIMVQSCVLTCTAALMEGTQTNLISPLIQAFLDSLPLILYSQNIKVRYHGGLALAQLCLHQHTTLDSMGAIPFILSIVNKSLSLHLDPHVVEHSCWALRYLTENLAQDKIQGHVGPQEYIQIAGLLFQTALSQFNQASSLEKVSYECLVAWLSICPDECGHQLLDLLNHLLERARHLPDHSPSLVYTCTALEMILSKLPEVLLQEKYLLLISELCQLIKDKTGMEDEAIAAITRILDRVPQQFLSCPLQPIIQLLLDTIAVRHDSSIMISCIGLISDIYRASFDHQQVPCPEYSPQLIVTLLDLAKEPSLYEGVRSVSLGTVSDILLCIETHALPVFPTISQVLYNLSFAAQPGNQLMSSAHAYNHLQSSAHDFNQLTQRIEQLSAKVNNQSESSDQPSYQLIKSIIETYSTLIQVFHQHSEFRQVFQSKHVDRLGLFIQSLDLSCCDNEILAVLCGLIGDMSKYLPEPDLSEYQITFLTILDRGLESGESKTRKIARWARDQIQPASSVSILKKARVQSRVEGDNNSMETSSNQTSTFRVSLSCNTSQFITQNIEESFTFNLKSKKENFTPIETFPPDINSNYVEATICLPSRNKQQTAVINNVTDAGSAVEPRDHMHSAVAQLRKLGKRRSCYLGENGGEKKLKDDADEHLFW